MFQTVDSAKLPISWKDSGENVWSYAELLVNTTWFYADCQLTDGVDTVSSTYLLSKSSQISDLLKNPNILIRSIYIVSPPYINGTDSWSMSALIKLSTGLLKSGDYETNIEIYELADGGKYYSNCEINSDECITKIKVVYS